MHIKKPGNQFLQNLSADDRALLHPHLQPLALTPYLSFEQPNRRIERVCFPDSGIVSIVAEAPGVKKGIEVGVIGREGLTGLPVILGDHRWNNSTFVQVPGEGRVMAAEPFAAALEQSPTLRQACLRFAVAFSSLLTQTALAHGRAKLSQRLARWLLMAQDRLQADDVPLTHELLAIMLGVRRPGVTDELRLLATKDVIRSERGRITIRDREKLRAAAGPFYGVTEREYGRIVCRHEMPVAAGSYRSGQS